MSRLVDITGKAISGEWGTDDLDGTGIPVLRTTNFTNEGIVDFNGVVTRRITKKNIAAKYLRYGDIIIEKSGGSDNQPVGRVIFFEGPEDTYLFNNFTGLLRVQDQVRWFPKYVFYTLFSNYKRGETRRFENRTTGLHNLQTESYINSVLVSDISYTEQVQVCKKLDLINELIDNCNDRITKLDCLIKAQFVEMFGDAVHNDKKWETDSVENLCDAIYGGGTPSKSHAEYYEGGSIPWVSSKDMKTDVIKDSQIHITQVGLDNSTARLVPVNSVIMVIRSGILKHTLPVAINVVPITVNQDLKVFIPGDRILTRFMAVQFKMHESDILSGVRAVTADNIEFNSFKKRQLIVPPIGIQQKYVDFVEQIDQSKSVVQSILIKLTTLQASLMQEHFG